VRRKGENARTPALPQDACAPGRLPANLKRAQAAPKDWVYRPTVTRLLAYRSNLVRALEVNRERQSLAGWLQDEHPQVEQKLSLDAVARRGLATKPRYAVKSFGRRTRRLCPGIRFGIEDPSTRRRLLFWVPRRRGTVVRLPVTGWPEIAAWERMRTRSLQAGPQSHDVL
jgi:hypothetical protein